MRGKAGKAARDVEDGEAPVVPPDDACKAGQQEPVDELAAVKDRLLRLQADFDNFRKRTVRERSEIHRLANEELIFELLPVLDNMELALDGGVEHGADPAILDGFRLVVGQLQSVLAKSGLDPVDAAAVEFDPSLHEAVSHLPSDTVPDGIVMVQTRRGYTLGGKLLRAAQVVVSSGAGPDGGRPIGADSPEPDGPVEQ